MSFYIYIHKLKNYLILFFFTQKIGVYQTDLTFIEDGNPSKFSSGLNNFKKCRLIASVITELQTYQQKPYNLTTCPAVEDFIKRSQEEALPFSDEKKLYDLSLESEPRDGVS